MDRLSLELGHLISPLSSTNALRTCWALEAEGKQAEGLAILKEAAGRGVPLPVGK